MSSNWSLSISQVEFSKRRGLRLIWSPHLSGNFKQPPLEVESACCDPCDDSDHNIPRTWAPCASCSRQRSFSDDTSSFLVTMESTISFGQRETTDFSPLDYEQTILTDFFAVSLAATDNQCLLRSSLISSTDELVEGTISLHFELTVQSSCYPSSSDCSRLKWMNRIL